MDKKKRLYLGLLLDVIGMISIVFPLFDIVWAPLSAVIILKMYKGNVGKVGSIVSFIEEALPIPGFDFIPTFTLTWLYVYVVKKKKKQE